MAQHDQVLNNNPGAVFIADFNAAMAAIFSSSSGDVEPQKKVPGQLWFDTYLGVLNIRNADNSGWLPFTANIDPSSTYTKDEADAEFALLSNVYTKTTSDGRFALLANTPTKAEADAKFNPIVDPIFAAAAAPTAKTHLDLSGVATGQDRAIRIPNKAPLGVGAWELIADDEIVSVEHKEYLNLGAFQILKIEGECQQDTVASGGLLYRYSKDNGATFISTATYARLRSWFSSAVSGDYSSSLSAGQLFVGSTFGNSTPWRVFENLIFGWNTTRYVKGQISIGDYNDAGAASYASQHMHWQSGVGPYNAIQFLSNTAGVLWSGHITIHGIRG